MAGKPGPKSPEHRAKIKASWTDERREKLSERSSGNRFAIREWTPEQRAARSLLPSPNKGKSLSLEHRQKLAAAHVGKSPRLLQYGITAEMYLAEVSAGNRWCSHGKHFVAAAELAKKGVCRSCNPHNDRRNALRKYGVTHGWYETKLAEQGGGCAICGGGASRGDKHLAVDYHHGTGSTRGILCSRCNTGIARFDAVSDWAGKALAYLASYS